MKLKLIRKQREVGNIWSFFFKPAEKITWLAGQSIRIELPKPTWGIDERRFTIASAPFEKYIQITTRISESGFKQTLSRIDIDKEVDGYAIEGDFLWNKDDMPRLFLAGGVGITAFRSLLAQAVHDKTELDTTLIYSFSDNEPLFKNELEKWQKTDKTFYIRYLPKAHLQLVSHSTLTPFWLHNQVYISGPEKMVDGLASALLRKGLPKSQLHLDEFTGNIKV